MTLDELKAAYGNLYKLIDNEIYIRQKYGDKYATKLADWLTAKRDLIAMKNEIKRHLPPELPTLEQVELIHYEKPYKGPIYT